VLLRNTPVAAALKGISQLSEGKIMEIIKRLLNSIFLISTIWFVYNIWDMRYFLQGQSPHFEMLFDRIFIWFSCGSFVLISNYVLFNNMNVWNKSITKQN